MKLTVEEVFLVLTLIALLAVTSFFISVYRAREREVKEAIDTILSHYNRVLAYRDLFIWIIRDPMEYPLEPEYLIQATSLKLQVTRMLDRLINSPAHIQHTSYPERLIVAARILKDVESVLQSCDRYLDFYVSEPNIKPTPQVLECIKKLENTD